jgi:hypothetical protein
VEKLKAKKITGVATKTTKHSENKTKTPPIIKCKRSENKLRKRKRDRKTKKAKTQRKSKAAVFKMPKTNENSCCRVGENSAFLPYKNDSR